MKLSNAALGLLALFALPLQASPMFDSGLPTGWACEGNCGTAGTDGDVTESPFGGDYGWVSSNGGLTGNNLDYIGGTNGSSLTSKLFSAEAGDDLEFWFNFITSDGAGYSDYAWARLIDEAMNEVALLFTARTHPSDSIVPGFDMPAPAASLNPTDVPIIGGAPEWSPLGDDSGTCYQSGCGYTGWIQSTFEIPTTANYFLQFGVANWTDTSFDSGLAFDGISVGGVAINQPKPQPVPEPSALWLALLGFGALVLKRRVA